MAARESRRVATVAALLDLDESQVRRLVDQGELEAHRIGKRGVRIYVDSVAAYQSRNARPVANRTAPSESFINKPATSAAHRASMGRLKKLGLV